MPNFDENGDPLDFENCDPDAHGKWLTVAEARQFEVDKQFVRSRENQFAQLTRENTNLRYEIKELRAANAQLRRMLAATGVTRPVARSRR
jgi:predicted RNase H-like nuclease (RuvC/YqgF family)